MAERAEARHVHRHAALIALAALGGLACGGGGGKAVTPAPATSASAASSAHAPPNAAVATAAKDKRACLPTAETHDEDTIAVIHVEGNARVMKHDICKTIMLKAGEKVDAAKIAADIRALWATRDFDDVQVTRRTTPDGSIVTFGVRERPIIEQVIITGEQAFDFPTLRKLVPIQEGAPADTADIRASIESLVAMYTDEGYRSMKVEQKLEPTSRGHVNSHFIIEEGPKALISTFAFKGLAVATEAELRPLFNTQGGTINAPGGVYREAMAERDLVAIRAHLYDKGLLEAKVDEPQLTLSADGKSVAVTVTVHEGPVFKIGTLHFTGDLVPDEKAYLKIFPLKPGDVFRRTAALEGLDKIKAYQAQKGKGADHVEPSTDIHSDKATVDVTIHIGP